MQQKTIFSSEFIRITEKADGYYIESFKKGMVPEQFTVILASHPEIKVTGVMAIRNALINAPVQPVKFGEGRERIAIEISDDGLKAYMTLSVKDEEIMGPGKADLFKEIIKKLNEKNIVFGVKNAVLLSGLCNNKQILVAEGIPSVNGVDSEIKMYELKEAKPEAKEDGNVDHYELNLINRVNAGDWLGERKDHTEGVPGKTVTGGTILPVKGRCLPLLYDKNTVKEVYENGVSTLYALITGAVHYEGDRIGVSNHLEITGDVDFRTGNIDFDGYLTVKGTIEDSFSVAASKDIEILGDFGLGSVKDIISKEGSIYIKGGIAGKNKAVIKSKCNIYTKFVSDTTIICDGSVHIGFYCMNSTIKAREVVLDSMKGQIIGGHIEAEIRVISSIIGSTSEKRTVISVSGFDRNVMKNTLDNIGTKVDLLRIELAKAKHEISFYTGISGFTREQAEEYEKIRNRYIGIKDNIKQLEDEKRNLVRYLKTHGDGEISVLKRVFPNTFLEIKGIGKEVNNIIMSTSFYFQDGQLKEL